jgi:alpha-L-rhamnosidase
MNRGLNYYHSMKILGIFMRPFLVLIILSAAIGVSARPAAPAGLLVNGVSNPQAVDRESIRFTWMSVDPGRGASQAAYQILVASSPERLTAGAGDYWDSGRVDSDQSAAVEYAGKPLPAATQVWWKVRVWDQAGTASRYSAPAYFDSGLGQSDWTAHYVWDGTANPNNFAYFRKTFVVNKPPARAMVYVTAHNDYLLYCNGKLLGRGPARCDPYHYGQYNGYDLTKLLTAGTNVFSAIGHWHGLFNDSGINAKPAFLLEARLDYGDGPALTIGTDESWKVLAHTAFIETNATYFTTVVRTGPPPKSRTSPPYMWSIPEETSRLSPVYSECDWGNGGASNRAAIQFDSRLEPTGWQRADFDDSGWASAAVVDRSLYHLYAQMAPLEREQGELKPVSIVLTNGAWIVDFGRCIDGWPKLTMCENHPGDKVRVEYFQMNGGRMPAGWDEYTCHGGTEMWDADCGRHTTFQAVKITGYAGKLKASDVRGIWAYCDADVAGHFFCSSPLLNDIYTVCERSARQNVQQGIISVDAQREQSPWTADSWNIGNVLIYNHRNTMMIDKVVRDYAGEQLPDGDFPSCCPAQRSSRIPEWSMYWPMLLWQQYLFSGDGTLLREMAPRLGHFLEWMKTYQAPVTKLVDPPRWRISDYAGGNMPKGGYNIATASQYYDNLCIAARVFSVLGQTNLSIGYSQEAEEVKAGINSNLFNGRFYLARTDTNTMFPLASAWALRFDLESASLKSEILAAIMAPGKPNFGGYGGDAFYSGLLNAGGGAFVVRDLERYRPMLMENKANWESFPTPPRDEVNHAWTAYPGYIFLKYICGIQPTSGGFATFDVRPETGGLRFAEGAVPTVKGLVTTRWEKEAGGQFKLSVTVPANTHATIYIPVLGQTNVVLMESGKALWPPQSKIKDPGVLAVREEGSSIKCLVGAGTYHFCATPSSQTVGM